MHPYANRSDDFLPDFCTAPRVIPVLVLCEAVAVVLTLAGAPGEGRLAERLLLLSIYLQWIGICSAAALCLTRRYAGRLRAHGLIAVSYLALLAVTLFITEVTFVAGRFTGIAPLVENTTHAAFLLRSLGICAVVSALALRYFWLRAAWQQRAQAEVRARLEALQARIEPHFLFNSLNSIAALIAIRPDDAEDAIEDLAALLRARLGSHSPELVRLDDELALIGAYVRIEKLRLDARLTLDWRIVDEARDWLIPTLCLQPLVENAIGHGVARLTEGGTVTITAQVAGGCLRLRVTNPVAADTAYTPGNRQALVNIEQRLALRYAKHAQLVTMQEHDLFCVDLIIPGQDDRVMSAHGPARGQNQSEDRAWT